MSSFDQFPELGEGEYAVLCTEADTGIVLSLEGAWALGQASSLWWNAREPRVGDNHAGDSLAATK